MGDDHIPTGKVVKLDPSSFTLMKSVLSGTEDERNDVMDGKVTFHKYYIGNRVFAVIQDPYWIVDVRCYFRTKISNNLRPTRNGFKLNSWKLTR